MTISWVLLRNVRPRVYSSPGFPWERIEMTQLFEITHEDIKQLNDSQLTDLLRRLLHLEATRSGIAARSVSVALNIDVPDGGEDGRIQWKRGPKSTNYIPSRLTM